MKLITNISEFLTKNEKKKEYNVNLFLNITPEKNNDIHLSS